MTAHQFAKPSLKFDLWVATLEPNHWAKYDLSAVRLGWEAAMDSAEYIRLQQVALIKKRQAQIKQLESMVANSRTIRVPDRYQELFDNIHARYCHGGG
jgi:hypothetical protein